MLIILFYALPFYGVLAEEAGTMGLAAQDEEAVVEKSIIELKEGAQEVVGDSAEKNSQLKVPYTTFIYLILLIFIAFWIVYFVRKSNFIPQVLKKNAKLKILETHVLGNKQFLVLVSYENKDILLGVGPGMINQLSTFEKKAFDSDKNEMNVTS